MDNSIPGALKLLNPGGSIIVADFFKTDAPGKSPLGGGHNYKEWQGKLENFPVKVAFERDITEETSVTMDIVHQKKKNYDYRFNCHCRNCHLFDRNLQ